ncbi:MAG TPA: AAA family ATPase [Candidatus Acidoferrum sp.]|nr:AAA family ATPase [Candidatus Acidoferrum sp.]
MATLTSELIGREAELRRMEAFLGSAQEGPQILLLEGDAGIGKTILWRTGRSAALSRRFRPLSAAPTDAEASLPYAVLSDLLDPFPEEAVGSLSDPLRIALEAALFRVRSEQGPADQLAVSTAFLRVVRHQAADQPVLLALDDLQWVDAPSMRVLTFALRRLDREAVKVLATLRISAGGGPPSAFTTTLGENRVQRIELGPLSRSAIEDLLLRRLERPLPKPELVQVHAISRGNPFFALEIGRFILEHPADIRVGEPLPVPQSLATAVSDHITRLPLATRDLLVGLVALARSDQAMLQQIDPDADATLDPAFTGQVIERSGGRLRFTHPLLASAVYGMADATTRRRWHARLSTLIQEPEERARHLALSATRPDPAVADALEQAAISANARGAPDAAAALAQQASDLTPAGCPEELLRRQVMRAGFRFRAGDAPGARDLLNAVLESSPTGSRPPSALRLMGGILFASGDLAEAERFLVEALTQANGDPQLQVLIERDLIRVLNQRGKLEASLSHINQLLDLAGQRGDSSLADVAMRLKAGTEFHLGIRAREWRDRAVAVVEDRVSAGMDDNPEGLHPLMDWAVILKWSDDFARARSLFKRALTLTEGRDESLRAPILFHLAEMECWAGDWLLAALYADECEKSVIHTGQRAFGRLSLVAGATLHCCRGELDAARSAAQEAFAVATDVGDEPYRNRALAILGATEVAAGQPDKANSYFEELRSRRLRTAERSQAVVRSDGDEVEALVALGRADEAQHVCDRLADDERLFDNAWQRAIGARCRALVASARGDLVASMTEFDRALAAHDLLPMPLERGRTLLACAILLRRAKQKRLAHERLEEAMGIFERLGASAWLQRAQAERSRITPTSAGVTALTPTEARVAALVASGRTNKEVGAALSLSVKTVEANLSRVYDKLSVRSRSELIVRMTSQRKDLDAPPGVVRGAGGKEA